MAGSYRYVVIEQRIGGVGVSKMLVGVCNFSNFSPFQKSLSTRSKRLQDIYKHMILVNAAAHKFIEGRLGNNIIILNLENYFIVGGMDEDSIGGVER